MINFKRDKDKFLDNIQRVKITSSVEIDELGIDSEFSLSALKLEDKKLVEETDFIFFNNLKDGNESIIYQDIKREGNLIYNVLNINLSRVNTNSEVYIILSSYDSVISFSELHRLNVEFDIVGDSKNLFRINISEEYPYYNTITLGKFVYHKSWEFKPLFLPSFGDLESNVMNILGR